MSIFTDLDELAKARMERSAELEARCRPLVEALLQEVVVRMGLPLENVEGNCFHTVPNGCSVHFRMTIRNTTYEREIGIHFDDDGVWRYHFREGGRFLQSSVDDPSLLVQFFELALRRQIRNRNPIITREWFDPSTDIEERLRARLLEAFTQQGLLSLNDSMNDSMAMDSDEPVASNRAPYPTAPTEVSAPSAVVRPSLWQHLDAESV